MMVCAAGSGWWALLIAPIGGFVFGGLSTTLFREKTQPASFFVGVFSNIIGIILIFVR